MLSIDVGESSPATSSRMMTKRAPAAAGWDGFGTGAFFAARCGCSRESILDLILPQPAREHEIVNRPRQTDSFRIVRKPTSFDLTYGTRSLFWRGGVLQQRRP